jgi:hypothetical protein
MIANSTVKKPQTNGLGMPNMVNPIVAETPWHNAVSNDPLITPLTDATIFFNSTSSCFEANGDSSMRV